MTQLLLRRGRLMIYLSAVWTAASIFFWAAAPGGDNRSRYLTITEYYALGAALLIYAALLVSPLLAAVPDMPARAVWLKLRRALGLSAFLFAGLHGGFAFFGVVGGSSGLARLGSASLAAVVIGATALTVLAALAATSFNAAVRRLGTARWKALHRLVYIVAVLVPVHAVIMPGRHFRRLDEPVFQAAVVASALMLSLQAVRIRSGRPRELSAGENV